MVQFKLHITLGLFFVYLAVLPHIARAQECADGVDACVTTVFGIIGENPDDTDLICSATDEFLACIVEATRTCDPVVTASVKEGITPMIELYTTDPYNCVLVNAEDEGLKHDECSEEMSLCGVYYAQARSEPRYSVACTLFEYYLSCMTYNTTSCGLDLRPFITEHSQNSTVEFDDFPYYCEERLSYDIEKVDSDMVSCMDVLNNLNFQIVKQDYVCGAYKSFINCAIETLAGASPRQFDIYVEQVNQASTSFSLRPYFCESEDPCMELFKSCNDSAYYPQVTPCELKDIYTSCISNSLSACSEEDYSRIAGTTQTLMGEIHNKYNCIEENNDLPKEEMTTEMTKITKPSQQNTDKGNVNNEGDVVPSNGPGTPTNEKAPPTGQVVTEDQGNSNQSGNVEDNPSNEGEVAPPKLDQEPSQPQETKKDEVDKDNAGTVTYQVLVIVAGSALAMLLQ